MKKLTIKHWPDETPIESARVADAWAQDGFDCDLWVDPPGQEWLNFVHSKDERVVVKDGALEVEVGGMRALLGPGDEVFVPAGSHHSVWNRGGTTARWFYGYRKR
jgi:mannose-6-phosphate isomerase-like protein (cupin superfamily)